MANKQVNVNLAFTADATAAKRQIQDLQKQLSQLASSGFENGSLGLSDEIENAIGLAVQLKTQLANATNASTGKLDLGRFNQSLKQSGTQLEDYKNALVSLGPDGQKAFSNLASAITKADLPIKRTSSLLSDMLVTLKNTAKWELSSKLMHGFESSVSSAYSYAQNLNKSLNDIRIVTSYNVDQMAQFAEQANKAAKALSTTTTDYTNASLIYYQQGLTDEEVLARTDVTIKMANVAGESATKVSDQLTAVWNNFYDGSKSLEYYADVMTKLGAATASSTDEIAEGLEKFAAIADTVGLSYEYATAALATVTSNTRQSADVVGTAFKTIFARMQDLELGDTLDDGTTLGTYSEALAKVGVNVLDTNGNLVEMDDLLDSIAAKWDDLSKAQQVSLAQSVAGVRQYTQLVALMDNWDSGDADSMVANLDYVSGAEGALQEQADIYAESWEASKDRVKAALESIYSSLIDEDFFIGFNNVLEWILGQVNALIKSLGGVPGILAVIGATVSNVFSKQLETSLDNFVYNLRFSLGVVKKDAEDLRTKAASLLNTTNANSISGAASDKAYLEQQVAQQLYIENAERLNSIESMTAQSLLKQHEARVQNVIAQGEIVEKAEEEAIRVRQLTEAWAKRQINESNLSDGDKSKSVQQLEAELDRAKNLEEVFYKLSTIPITNEKNLNPAAFEKVKSILKDVEKQFGKIEANNQALGKGIGGKAAEALAKLSTEAEKGAISMETFVDVYSTLGDSDQTRIDNLTRIFTNLGVSEDEARQRAEGLVNAYANLGNESAKLTEEQQALANSTNHLEKFLKNAQGQTQSFSSVISASVSAFSSLAMSITSIKGMVDTLNDTDISGWDKALTIATQMGFVLPNLISSVQKLTQVFGPSGYIGSLVTANAILGEHTAEITKNTTAEMANELAKKWANNETEEQAIKAAILTKIKQEQTKATNADTLAEIKNIAVKLVKNKAMWAAIIIMAAVTTAIYLAVKAYNADAEAAERAAEGAQNLADAYSECKQEYEEMISAMENYQTARDGLNELTKGTEEYNEALKEANRQAQDLINNYGLIEGQDYEWEGQELVIKDESLNRVKAEKEKEVDVAYGASQMAQVKADRAQEKADQTALKRQIRDDNGVGTGDQWWKGALGLATGLGTMAALTNIAVRAGEASEYDAAIDAAVEEARNNSNLFSSTKDNMAETLNLDDQDLIDALWANKDSIQALSDDLEAADRAEKLAAQEASNEIMAGKGYENTKSGQGALEAGGGVYQQLYNDAYEEYKNTKMANWLGVGTSEGKAMWSKYAAQQGISDLNGYEVTKYRKDGSVEYEYIDENGDPQKKIATAEEIAATLAAADAANALEGTLSQLRSELAKLSNSANLADHALADFLSEGNLESSTKAEFEQLQADVGYEGKDENGNAIVDTVKVDELLGLTGDASADLAKAKERGYETAEAYRQAFIDSLDIEWEVPEGLEFLDEVLTVGSSDKIRSTYKELGEDGGQAFIEALKIATSGADWEGLDAEQQQAMLNELANIDWSSWDAGDKAIAIAKEYGVAIDGASEAWQNNIDTMRDVANALPDFEALSATLKEIKEISDDIDLGSVLSAEDYNTLVAYNSELEKYFTILSDGSAQFIGDKLDFQQTIKESTQADLERAISDYQDRVSELEAQQKAGLEALGGKDVNGYTSSENYVGDDGENHYSGTNVNTQLNFLESQGYDADQLAKWKEDLADGTTQVSVLEDIASAVDGVADSYNGLGNEIESNKELTQGAMNEMALSAEDAEERMSLLESGKINENAYNNAAMAAHNTDKWEGLDADEVEDYSKSLMKAAKSSELLSDDLEDNAEAAEDVALYTKRMNKGIDALSGGIEDWSDVLENSDEASEEYADAMSGIKGAMSDVLGVSKDFISDDFILQHMDDIKLAAEGDAEAIDRLAIAAATDILINIDFADDGVREKAMSLHSDLTAMIPDIKVGATLDDGEFLQKAQEIVTAAGMSVDEANAYFNALGFETKFATEEQPVEQTNPKTVTKTEVMGYTSGTTTGPDGEKREWEYPILSTSTYNDGYSIETGLVDAIAMTSSSDGEPATPVIKSITRKSSGAMNNYSSSNSGGSSPGKSKSGGGGSSKSKTADKKKESDVLDRYKEITDALDDVTRATEKASKAADRLYGKSRIDAMKQANASLQQEISLLKQKKSEAESYLDIDKQALDAAASAAGVSFSYDSEGNISNYTSQMQALLDQYNALVDQVNADGDVSEEEQEKLDTLSDLIDKLKEAISQYDDTKELLQDLDEQITDKFYEWQDNNYEILHYELEIEIELNDLQLEYIDYYLNKIEDDFYSMAEAAQYMTSQIPLMTDSLGDYENFYNKITQAYANGEISQADYVDGMKEAYSSILDQLQALKELDKEMMHYYEDTLDAASEELSKYTDRMEHLTSVLGHYKNLIELINGEYDYESIGKILDGQAKTLKNELDVLTANYKMLLTEKEAIEQSLANAQDDAARELFQEELDAINAAVDEAQENMLAKTEEWAEAQKAIMENAMAEAAAEMEKAFTDGMGFDALSNSLSRLSSYADEYLTKTNQMYETQKLINTAQQAADKSTNEAAKARLKAYTDEIEQLQNKNQLSNLELEIAKAKYDVVLAEIALEEAQNAKSTVRLQRDSEGNFGYVYTSDQEQISQAEQDLADAQNALYNIGLEGANEYGQKLLELKQQLADELVALEEARAAGQYATDEEYYAARDQLIQEYNDLFLAYSEQYTTAMGVDTAIQEEAWVNAYENMINKTGEWQIEVIKYTGNCEGAYQNWRTVVETESEEVNSILNDVESEVKEVTKASDDLKNEVVGSVIPAIKNELSAVREVTSAYAAQRAQIQELIQYYEQLALSMAKTVQQQSGVGYDPTADYSALMGTVEVGSAQYNQYKEWRERKISEGYTGTGSEVSTARIDAFYQKRLNLKNLGYNYFTEIPEDEWKKLVGFASGGYTGSWGPEGKLTMLHEKELVLNADDTVNFLKGIDIIRSIADSIDLKALQSQIPVLPYNTGAQIQSNDEMLEQSVHIEANFPNVQDRNEIQEAFNNLINTASQYANRK